MSLEQLLGWIAQYGYGSIFVLLTLGIVGLPIPDETLLTLTGYLIFRGTLSPVPSYLASCLGTMCGITLSYGIGKSGGVRLLRRFGRFLHLPPDRIARANRWFHQRGKWSLTTGYFVPGFRHVIAIIAGSSGVRLPHFALFAYSGAAVWAAVFLYAGYALGEEWKKFPQTMRTAALIIAPIGALVFIAYRFLWKRWRTE
jgi:membrane protein DedA with SNARE-associated domain